MCYAYQTQWLCSTEFDDDKSSGSSDDMDEYGSDADLEEPSLSPPSPTKQHKKGEEDLLGIQDYMDLMDRELAGSKVGQSFEREQPAAVSKWRVNVVYSKRWNPIMFDFYATV